MRESECENERSLPLRRRLRDKIKFNASISSPSLLESKSETKTELVSQSRSSGSSGSGGSNKHRSIREEIKRLGARADPSTLHNMQSLSESAAPATRFSQAQLNAEALKVKSPPLPPPTLTSSNSLQQCNYTNKPASCKPVEIPTIL